MTIDINIGGGLGTSKPEAKPLPYSEATLVTPAMRNETFLLRNARAETIGPYKTDTVAYLKPKPKKGGKRKTKRRRHKSKRKTRKNKKGGIVTNDTRLIAFTRIGNEKKVRQLLEKGADVNAPTAYGNGTALFEAIQYNHKDIVKILIENGADVNKVRNDGVTPLILAIQYNNTEIIKILLNAGANTDKPDSLPAYGNDYGREVLNMAEAYANKKNMRMIIMIHGLIYLD